MAPFSRKRIPLVLAAVCAIGLCAWPMMSQKPGKSADPPESHWDLMLLDASPAGVGETGSTAVGDIDGDGKPEIVTGPRIGLTKAVDLPWRYGMEGSRYLSKPF